MPECQRLSSSLFLKVLPRDLKGQMIWNNLVILIRYQILITDIPSLKIYDYCYPIPICAKLLYSTTIRRIGIDDMIMRSFPGLGVLNGLLL